MKFSILFRALIAAAFLCLLTIPAAAQYLGPGIGSNTFIYYDEETNTVTAYSQTDTDYELMGDYQAYVSLTVRNDYGTAVASGSATDDYGDGFAAVELSFAGAAGATYTATGVHRGIATLYDYDYDPPYNRIFYFDNWYFTPFEAQNVYEPWQYFFSSPGYTYHTRRTERINLGSTHDSASTIALANEIKFDTVSNDVTSNVANFDQSITQTATVNLSGAARPVCEDATSFNVYVSFTLPPNAISVYDSPRSTVSHNQRQQFSYNPPLYLQQVNYTQHTATVLMRVHRVDESQPDNSLTLHISGGKSGGGSYNGAGRVRFVCQ